MPIDDVITSPVEGTSFNEMRNQYFNGKDLIESSIDVGLCAVKFILMHLEVLTSESAWTPKSSSRRLKRASDSQSIHQPTWYDRYFRVPSLEQ